MGNKYYFKRFCNFENRQLKINHVKPKAVTSFVKLPNLKKNSAIVMDKKTAGNSVFSKILFGVFSK